MSKSISNALLANEISNSQQSSERVKGNFGSPDIGIVFQSYNLLPFMTASENIILSMDASGVKVADKKSKAIKLMKSVGLKESYANRKVLKLSGGEQQRVAISRSLCVIIVTHSTHVCDQVDEVYDLKKVKKSK